MKDKRAMYFLNQTFGIRYRRSRPKVFVKIIDKPGYSRSRGYLIELYYRSDSKIMA